MRSFTVYDMYKRNALLNRNRTALVSGTERITFSELLKKTERLAIRMADAGIGKGDRIGILAFNHPDFFLIFGAAAALGAIAVPINWRLSDKEIEYILRNSDPAILVTDKGQQERIRETVQQGFPKLRICTMAASGFGEMIGLQDFTGEKHTDFPDISGDDPFCLIYTAAVEGKPRGAVLSHGNMIYGNMQTAATMGLSCNDSYLNMLPLFHITGLNLAFTAMQMGGKNVLMPKFDEKQCMELTQAEKISMWGSFPPMLSRLSDTLDTDSYDISSLRIVLGLDGPEPIRSFEQKSRAVFWILYGQTETTGLVTFSPAMEKAGSAGKPGFLTKVRLTDENEKEVPTGMPGEITVRGPLVFRGFYGQEEVNRRAFRNGWHHTGDMGVMDEEGYLWFKGRKPEKELIKPGGENVYPAEVEAVILEHPAVKAVSVIGVPDPKFGEGIKAVCVLKPGKSLTLHELGEFVAERIARYKKPQYAEFVAELPLKADGSADREKVKEMYGK